MLIKPGYPIAALLIVSVLFNCCNQMADSRTTPENNNLRLPVSVNDSLSLSLDKSPMDISYFPEDYPKQKMITPDMPNPVARVIYSRPKKNGRIIFADSSVTGDIIQQYGQEWRLGANEATEIEFYKEVTINEKKIAAGRYILYCIPYPDKWKMIINQNLYSWGLHIDKTKDIAEMDIPVNKTGVQAEYFTMIFKPAAGGCVLIMSWGDVNAVLPIKFR
jgi:hypothetical protein